MGAVFFYQMSRTTVETTLPLLVTKSRAAGWRVFVRAPGEAAAAQLDDLLWTYDAASFLPHGRIGADDHPQAHPVLIGTEQGFPPDREALIALDAGPIAPDEAQRAARAMILFYKSDEAAVGRARGQWRALTEAGLPAQYWSDEDGGWQKKAESQGAEKA